MWKEFKKFALRGNVLDLAVGVIIGGAFGKIVTSVVNDLVMPLLSLLLGRIDLTNLFWALDGGSYPTLAAAKEAGAAVFSYGQFLNNVVDFLVIAWIIFLVVRQANRLRRKEPAAPATTKTCPYCQSTISQKAVRCPHCTSNLGE